MTGEYGPYISYKLGTKISFMSIPKDKNPKDLTNNEILALISKKKKNKFDKKIKNI